MRKSFADNNELFEVEPNQMVLFDLEPYVKEPHFPRIPPPTAEQIKIRLCMQVIKSRLEWKVIRYFEEVRVGVSQINPKEFTLSVSASGAKNQNKNTAGFNLATEKAEATTLQKCVDSVIMSDLKARGHNRQLRHLGGDHVSYSMWLYLSILKSQDDILERLKQKNAEELQKWTIRESLMKRKITRIKASKSGKLAFRGLGPRLTLAPEKVVFESNGVADAHAPCKKGDSHTNQDGSTEKRK